MRAWLLGHSDTAREVPEDGSAGCAACAFVVAHLSRPTLLEWRVRHDVETADGVVTEVTEQWTPGFAPRVTWCDPRPRPASAPAHSRPVRAGGAVEAAARVLREAFVQRPEDHRCILEIVNATLADTAYRLGEATATRLVLRVAELEAELSTARWQRDQTLRNHADTSASRDAAEASLIALRDRVDRVARLLGSRVWRCVDDDGVVVDGVVVLGILREPAATANGALPDIPPLRQVKLGATLRALRELSGRSMGDMARALGVTTVQVSDWEIDRAPIPEETRGRYLVELAMASEWRGPEDGNRTRWWSLQHQRKAQELTVPVAAVEADLAKTEDPVADGAASTAHCERGERGECEPCYQHDVAPKTGASR